MNIRTARGLALLPVIAILCLIWSFVAFYSGKASSETWIIAAVGALTGAISTWTGLSSSLREDLISFFIWSVFLMVAGVIFHALIELFYDEFSWRHVLLNAFLLYVFMLLCRIGVYCLDKISDRR